MERHFFYKRNYKSKAVRKNAFWMEVNGTKYLISYRTVVAAVNELGYFYKFWNDYSDTTKNQINCFINTVMHNEVYSIVDGTQIIGFNKKEWLDYPITNKVSALDYAMIKPLLPTIEYSDRSDYVEKIIYD